MDNGITRTGKKEEIEKDMGRVYNSVQDNEDGTATGYARAACPVRDIDNSRPTPHNVQMNRIVEDIEYRQTIMNPDTASVRYALRQVRAAYGMLFRAFKHWVGLKQCQFFWHDASDGMWGNRVCRRCGAWRD